MRACRRACDVSALDDVLAAVAGAMRQIGSRWYLFGAQEITYSATQTLFVCVYFSSASFP